MPNFRPRTPRWWPRWAAVALVTTSAFGVAACSQADAHPAARTPPHVAASATGPVASRPRSTPEPKVGECWRTTPTLTEGLTWEGGPAVSCTGRHNALTFAVGLLLRDQAYPSTTRSRGPWTTSVVRDACAWTQVNSYLGRGGNDTPLRFATSVYIPSPAQWAAGVRSFRCDLGSLDVTPGIRHRQWTALPADLSTAVARRPMSFSYCSTGGVTAGPNKKDTRFGPCKTGRRWVLSRMLDLAKRPDEAYPGARELERRAGLACWAPTVPVSMRWSRRAGWTSGDTFVECWVRRTGASVQ